MGEVVGAGLIAHVPTIVLPEKIRRELNDGEDTTLVSGLQQLRTEVFETLEYDTVVVLDSHWATTVEFVVTAQDRRAGLFTSEELPRGMCRRPYDFPGDPELARLIASKADDHGTWITAIDDEYLPIFYATTNLWEYLGEGLPDKKWVSIGVCQTADTEDNLRLGRALGDAIAESDRKVVLIASGAHEPHVLAAAQAPRPRGGRASSTSSPRRLRRRTTSGCSGSSAGDHARVLDTMPEFYRYKPEARFGHYLMMIGALGEGDCTRDRPALRRVRELGRHRAGALWFDRPEGGFPRPRRTAPDADVVRQNGGPNLPAAGWKPHAEGDRRAAARDPTDPAGRQRRGRRAPRRHARRRRRPRGRRRGGRAPAARAAVEDRLRPPQLLPPGRGDDDAAASGADLLPQAGLGAERPRGRGGAAAAAASG